MRCRSTLFIAISLGFAGACASRDPQAVSADCPADAPCFVSVVAPTGRVEAPGPFTMLVEVTGPQRIEGVGLVLSVNGDQSRELWLARAGQGSNLWHVPDLEADDVDPPSARDTAQALAQLQPGDRVTYLLWAYDQGGAQTQFSGSGEAGALSFEVMTAEPVADAGPGAIDGGEAADAAVAPSVDAG